MTIRVTAHARRRTRQRGTPMSRRRLEKAAEMIRSGDPSCVFIRKLTEQRSVYAVPHAGEYRPVVYHREKDGSGVIVTVLPANNMPLHLQRKGAFI